ncbi:Histone acetyltransferase [Cladophialophora chaetospira]|uniref:Histone acetyltransferase n=1 Tax=Cladophialophora chaetospira TaxID=386627 RepID=A0AA38XIQ6_9EURO|nr:Histone acetyltransferase [Cladophialophora chaetospira]
MPLLVSEDILDDESSIGTGTATPSGEEPTAPASIDETSQSVSRQSPVATEDPRNASTESRKTLVEQQQTPTNASSFEDYVLGEQLQRSAEEGLSEQDGGSAVEADGEAEIATAQTEAKEDVTMTDADADGDTEPDKEVLPTGTAVGDNEMAEEDADVDADGEGNGGDQEDAEDEEEQTAEGAADEEDAQGESETEAAVSESEESSDSADGEDEGESSAPVSKSVSRSASGSGSESGSESGAEGEGEAGEEAEEPNVECMFCHGSEAADGPGAALDLTCSECNHRAHMKCARDKGAVKDENTTEWQCPDCPKNTTLSESPKEQAARSKNSAPRLVRDLLPVTRGVQKPNSHSIFAQPLISEGEDGGRALRKRKSPTQEPVPMEKRRRKATERASAAAVSSAAMSVDGSTSTAMSTRRSSQMKSTKPTARVLQHRPFNKPPPHKFILAFRLEQPKIEAILNKPPRPGPRRRDRKAQQKKKEQKIPPPIYQPPVPKFPALPTHNLIFPSAFTDREAELNAKPYGGILSEAEADTSRSLPQLKDREIFEIARKEAEEERRRTSAAAEAEINGGAADAAATPGAATSTTKPNRSTVSGPPSKIKCIQFGKHVIDTFYAAPYPEEYSHESRLFICEFCLKYLPSEFVAYRHKLKCPAKHPPGDEIYRDGTVSVWEVDGRKKTEYCQCLCLMAKMFLGSKTLYYDVEPFLFYILTEYDELGYHFVGYFSKEKRPASQNNVSCILVMPIHQRKGYATFLIDFSYLLTRIERKEGSPEKPLSDMGLTAYRSYWDLTISRHLLALVASKTPFSTKTLMGRTGMTADDVIHSLERLYAFIKDPVTKTYAIRFDKKLYERIVDEFERKGHRQLKPDLLVWTPYIMGRSDREILDGQGPLNALAPRSDDEGEEEQEEDEADEDVDMESQVVPSKAGKSVAEDTEMPDTDMDAEQVSPRSRSKSTKAVSRPVSVAAQDQETADVNDPALINERGHVAPGPPSMEALNGATSTSITATQSEVKVNGLVNGTSGSQEPSVDPQHQISPTQHQENEPPAAPLEVEATAALTQAPPEENKPPPSPPLRGYALAYRQHAIPPTRFQIDPPIPPSMLRRRDTKKRSAATAFGTPGKKINGGAGGKDLSGAGSSVAVRSSPRHAAQSSGLVTNPASGAASSINGTSRGSASPKVPGTPVRRSGRRSGLATVVTTVDGSVDEEEQDEEEEDAPAEDDDEVTQPKTDQDADAEEEDDEEASSSSSEEGSASGSVAEEVQTSVAAASDASDVESASADEESAEEGSEEGDEEEESGEDDPNDPDAEPDDEESEESEEDDDDPDVATDLADDEEVDGDGTEEDGDEDAEAEDDD